MLDRGDPEDAFREVLQFLRARTGRDFSYYKRATILRRISRRMQVDGVDDMPGYLGFLRTHQGECGALLKDLLISVTNFYRDRDAFSALEACIPALFAGKSHGDAVRVWCPACATGEETYSLAILLMEQAERMDSPPAIQVFGCDLDEDAVQTARAGIYPDIISADVSEERLRRFFLKEHRGYRVRRELRECVLFACHDLLKDAPFSRLDLISCRNLLIYLSRQAQARALDIFHFALKPDGLLFLGSSESVDEAHRGFRILDKKNRLYRRISDGHAVPLPAGASTRLVRQIEQQVALLHAEAEPHRHPVAVPAAAFAPGAAVPPLGYRASAQGAEPGSWSELHFKLLERLGPPSALVDRDYDIQHLSESAGQFLQLAGGEPSTNLLRLANPELRVELRALLFRASQSGAPAAALAVPFPHDGEKRAVDLRVVPAEDLASGYLLVTFDLRETLPAASAEADAAQSEPVLRHLERELEQMRGHLRDIVEQYEASTEELKASNEELQAMNEELRSATEELETSREELQSINEELVSVNQEAKNKVEELAQSNSDLQNLMSATQIATVFLDRDMRVMRFTEPAAPIFNLIPGDVGRPLSDLQHRVNYPDMEGDAQRVLQSLLPVEREVGSSAGNCYLARMLPYRTAEDRIAGVVLTFVDVTERQRAAAELKVHNEQLERFAEATVGRELRMVELKSEVNELSARLGEPARYSLDFEQQTD